MRHHLAQYLLKHPTSSKPVPTLENRQRKPPQQPTLPTVNTTQRETITPSDSHHQVYYCEDPATSGFEDIINTDNQSTTSHNINMSSIDNPLVYPMCNSIHSFSTENEEFIESFE